MTIEQAKECIPNTKAFDSCVKYKSEMMGV